MLRQTNAYRTGLEARGLSIVLLSVCLTLKARTSVEKIFKSISSRLSWIIETEQSAEFKQWYFGELSNSQSSRLSSLLPLCRRMVPFGHTDRLLNSLVGDSLKNQIRVWEYLCTPNPAESTGTVTKCSVPALATQNSIDNFKITGEQYLMDGPSRAIPPWPWPSGWFPSEWVDQRRPQLLLRHCFEGRLHWKHTSMKSSTSWAGWLGSSSSDCSSSKGRKMVTPTWIYSLSVKKFMKDETTIVILQVWSKSINATDSSVQALALAWLKKSRSEAIK